MVVENYITHNDNLGDMEDDSTFKHHDVVPGAQLSLHIWNAWLSLIQACCNGNVKEV